MTTTSADKRLPEQEQASSSDNILGSVESTGKDVDEYGDETQRNETIEAEQGLRQRKFLDPREDPDAEPEIERQR